MVSRSVPVTQPGITVFEPWPENAPCIPWMERVGYLQRCMRVAAFPSCSSLFETPATPVSVWCELGLG